jgi:fused signal recognition particle receptor
MAFFNLFGKRKNEPEDRRKLDDAVEKTRDNLLGRIGRAFMGKSRVDDDFLDELEEILITADVGIDTTLAVIERLKKAVGRDKYMNEAELQEILRREIAAMLPDHSTTAETALPRPYIIMVVGVNGVGKTTTIGKLASQFKSQGLRVLLGAGDTWQPGRSGQRQTW